MPIERMYMPSLNPESYPFCFSQGRIEIQATGKLQCTDQRRPGDRPQRVARSRLDSGAEAVVSVGACALARLTDKPSSSMSSSRALLGPVAGPPTRGGSGVPPAVSVLLALAFTQVLVPGAKLTVSSRPSASEPTPRAAAAWAAALSVWGRASARPSLISRWSCGSAMSARH